MLIFHPNWIIAGFIWSYDGFSRVLQVFSNLPRLSTPRIGPDIHAGSKRMLETTWTIRCLLSGIFCSDIRPCIVLIANAFAKGGRLIHLQIGSHWLTESDRALDKPEASGRRRFFTYIGLPRVFSNLWCLLTPQIGPDTRAGSKSALETMWSIRLSMLGFLFGDLTYVILIVIAFAKGWRIRRPTEMPPQNLRKHLQNLKHQRDVIF